MSNTANLFHDVLDLSLDRMIFLGKGARQRIAKRFLICLGDKPKSF